MIIKSGFFKLKQTVWKILIRDNLLDCSENNVRFQNKPFKCVQIYYNSRTKSYCLFLKIKVSVFFFKLYIDLFQNLT